MCSCVFPLATGDDGQDDFTLFVGVDETKVSIVSGNLSVAVTRDWPRIVFWHTVDPFSPTFDIGFPKLYLFNDTDGDGRFCRSETEYTVFLDSNHVYWNLSSVHSDFDSLMGEFVMFSMSAQADAYNSTLDAPPAIESWANVTFWFCLAEHDATYEGSAGPHTVSGRIEMFVNMTVEVTNRTDAEAVAVERLIQGGGATNMFHMLEDGPSGGVDAILSGRVDESVDDEGFTRPLNGTIAPTQSVELAKDDGTVQAFYRWDAEGLDLVFGSAGIAVNSSCFTTGTGLMLHSALPLSNGTAAFSFGSSLGIVEDGFIGRMSEWLKEHSTAVAAVGIIAVAVSVVGLHMVLRRRRLRREGGGDAESAVGP